MRSFLITAAVALLGFAATADRAENREIRIITDETGAVFEDVTGQGRGFVLAGPRVSIPFEDGVTLSLDNLDGSGVTTSWDQENEWAIVRGSYEVEIRQGEEVKARFRVRNATMVIGEFEGDEGWTG